MEPRTQNKPGRMHRTLAKWSRWLHIYLSMLSLGAILFFSLTGFTLNHPDWFFRESTSRYSGNLDKSWLHLNMPGSKRFRAPDR
jgi:hypothetical protein